MPLNKQQLLQENNTNFPNNNSQLITPELLRQFNADMIDSMQLTQSMSEYAKLNESNTFTANQTIAGNLNVTGVISASVLHVQIETASVIFSTGSNQLGDELTDVQTLSGSVKIQGTLLVNGLPIATGSVQVDTGSLVTTASFNAYTESANQRLTSLETNSASVNVSITNLNQTTASLNTSITNLNAFSASQRTLNGTFATTGSNTFTGNQIIDRASKLYTNGVYWTDMTAGFNNLEIINQGGGNLDFASLNGGRMRVVNTPLQLTGSILSSNSDISTSANVYGANLTGSTINTGSLLVTASVNNDDITFTKGDGSQFTIQVATGSFAISSSYAETASYAQFATDIYLNVKNTTGAQLNKGTVVRIIGATGDNALIQTASWTNDANSANTLGFLYENIANDGFGKVITQGTLLGINTDPTLGYAAGQILYLSSSGQYTNVKPDAPYHEVRLGQVLRAQQNNGSMYVLIQNGYELDELHDVDINTGSLANKDILAYDSASQQWENWTINGLGLATTGSNTFVGNQIISGTINTTQDITVSSVRFGFGNPAGTSSIAIGNSSTLQSNTGQSNVAIGNGALTSNTTGYQNIAIGLDAAANNTTGNSNTAIGSGTFRDNISGSNNFFFGAGAGLFAGSVNNSVAIGNQALLNVKGDNNIAIGNEALLNTTTGVNNLAIGIQAAKAIIGNSNTNVAIGGFALNAATSSTNTLALGYAAMEFAENGSSDTAIGVAALYRKKANSVSNTAIGFQALRNHYDGDTHGGQNMAFGLDAMANVTSGSANTAIGPGVLRDASRANENVFIGWISGINTSGSIDQNVVIGPRAGQKLANSSNTIIGHDAGANLINGGANTFIGQGAGNGIVTGSQNTLIGRSLVGVDNWNNVIAISDGTGLIKTKFQSNIWEFTGSVDIENTLTASLQQGYVWVGNAAGRTTLVATSSFGGGGSINTGSFATTGSNTFTGDQTFIDAGNNFFTITDTSGSMMLVGKSYTSASAHLSASVPSPSGSFVNLIFKTNNVTADTIISGSNNIFQNPAAPTAGFKRYLGSNNIFLNGVLPQISGSMQFSPAVNANMGAVIGMRGPVSASTMQVANNISAGGVINLGQSAILHAQGLVGISIMSNNIVAGTFNAIANQSNIQSITSLSQNNINGFVRLDLSSSALTFSQNTINDAFFVFTNQYSSGSLGFGAPIVSNNTIAGTNNTIILTGSQQLSTNTIAPNISQNMVNGSTNTIFVNASTARLNPSNRVEQAMLATSILGNRLNVTASSDGGDVATFGSAFVGRFNAVDGVRDKSSDIVFAVGTGTSTSNRKTGFHITSGSNSFFEGTVNVSGSLLINGAAPITTAANNTFTGVNTFNERIVVQGVNIMSGSSGTVYIGNRTNFNPDSTGVPTQFSHTVLGMNALNSFVLGDRNTVIGRSALQTMATGSDNLVLGAFAGEQLVSGSRNFFVGTGAGGAVQFGSDNFFLGQAAANQFRSGSSNIVIGSAIGTQFRSGSGNLFIGRYGDKVVDNVDNQFSVTYGDLNASRVNLFYKSGSQNDNLFLYGGLEVDRSLIVAQSATVGTVLQLTQLDPLPSGVDGQMAVSASNLYFYSGSAWNKIAFG